MKIILSGGGTIGSVTPLLAIAEELKQDEILFVGTKAGPEKEIVQSYQLKYKEITSGKLRRYWDIDNFADIINIIYAFFECLLLLNKEKPDVIVSAGGFVSVPLVWAGWLLGIKSVVHSQDINTGLAIKLMKPFATKLTKAFSDAKLEAEWVGNPIRDLTSKTSFFKLNKHKPIILLTGGGTGAEALNKLVNKELLEFVQIIHITGYNKTPANFEHPDYQHYQFLKEEFLEAINKADLIITRAGLGALSEFASLGKLLIIVPIPASHQEFNAQYFSEHKAAVVLTQNDLTLDKLKQEIKTILADNSKQQVLKENIKKIFKPNAKKRISQIIQQCAKSS